MTIIYFPMKNSSIKPGLKTVFAATLATAGVVVLATSTEARPYPDQSGVCYIFQGDTQELMEPCVISSGYGAGAHYATLHWSDETTTSINMDNSCDPDAFDANGFCSYTINDRAAEYYERDVFMGVAAMDDPDNMPCYRLTESDVSVCYRFNE